MILPAGYESMSRPDLIDELVRSGLYDREAAEFVATCVFDEGVNGELTAEQVD